MYVNICVCVCVCERERENKNTVEWQGKKGTEKERDPTIHAVCYYVIWFSLFLFITCQVEMEAFWSEMCGVVSSLMLWTLGLLCTCVCVCVCISIWEGVRVHAGRTSKNWDHHQFVWRGTMSDHTFRSHISSCALCTSTIPQSPKTACLIISFFSLCVYPSFGDFTNEIPRALTYASKLCLARFALRVKPQNHSQLELNKPGNVSQEQHDREP